MLRNISVLLILLMAACKPSEEQIIKEVELTTDAKYSGLESELVLLDGFGQVADVFIVGETITMQHTTRNTSTETQSITLEKAQKIEGIVMDLTEGRSFYDSNHTSLVQSEIIDEIAEVTLQPGEAVTYSIDYVLGSLEGDYRVTSSLSVEDIVYPQTSAGTPIYPEGLFAKAEFSVQ